MKMMILMMVLTVKLAVALTGHPRALFDALHAQGESSEGVERTRASIALFATIRDLRVIRWMAEKVFSPVRDRVMAIPTHVADRVWSEFFQGNETKSLHKYANSICQIV
ncbi:hypothetical protein HAQ01_03045 [Acidithiobacillus thiooxidans]|nr:MULTISPECIES: hypothetical protein [Acidithiobacillus]MBU2743600.1 hypothetical protein [Acidithiobacillus albertensis]MBU2792409.1 hypothetical protein [Acidithiobacillus thiooxidans]MBU2843193.1 hypothetical protein [Acidithiobacillus thiooxidans]